jgi:hypothetical protein
MRLSRRIVRRMPMLVMDVMRMPVLMFEWLMQVLVLVPLREMQIDADRHKQGRGDEGNGQRLAE